MSDLFAQLSTLRAAQCAEGPPSRRDRVRLLQRLLAELLARREALCAAVDADFGGRSRHETLLAEIFPTAQAARHALRHLGRWMTPRRVWPGRAFLPAAARVTATPAGVVGVVGPWNYPVLLTLSPVIAAIAAGNRVMVKPSEHCPGVAHELDRLLAAALGSERVTVVQGDEHVGREFCRLPFDHLLFTGSTGVGRAVLAAAAENLVPVTLELGSKSPVIVADDHDIDVAAQRIASGKLLSAGQTCVAPDYVLLPKHRQERFVAAYRAAAQQMYGRYADNPDYTAVHNDRHLNRLQQLIAEAREGGAEVISLAGTDDDCAAVGKLAPCLVLDAPQGCRLLREEIFGPVLPLVSCPDVSQAMAFVGQRPRPLVVYLFSHDRSCQDQVRSGTTSGALVFNETLLQKGVEGLPFGGTGESGMGRYHGRAGFETFSVMRSEFQQSQFNLAGWIRPPYGPRTERLLRWLLIRD